MEDSHIALTDISDNQLKSFLEEHAVKTSTDPAVSLFGVFDGHGGKHEQLVLLCPCVYTLECNTETLISSKL